MSMKWKVTFEPAAGRGSPVNRPADVLYIDTPDALEAFCGRLREVDWFALDTEFLREKTYYPKLCLLQIATRTEAACIDPLALPALTPLLEIFANPAITKVMHSGRQDMEIFYHLAGVPPAPVFDTQVAAPLLGYADQIGYANLVREVLGVTLDKLHTRADWSLRPLTHDQLRYAADDVIYLVDVYLRLRERLEQNGRLAWLDDDFRQLASAELYQSPPQLAWLKVKGANRLNGAALSVLQALAAWREQLAQDKDLPRGWLMKDDVMIDLARHRPATQEAMGTIRGLGERLVQRNGPELLLLIEQAAQRKPEPFPKTGSHERLDPDQDALVDVMMAVARISAEEHTLNPAMLATRKQLEALVLGDHTGGVMQGWRRKLIGDRLQQLLDGKLALTVRNGRLVL
jgi:ribonuclease D